jgi:phage-related tail protein
MAKTLKELLYESVKKNDKDEKEKKIIFVETDPLSEFPSDTVKYLQKEINKKSKDLSVEWKNAIELLDDTFNEFEVPIPKIFQTERWEQYSDLIKYTVEQLKDSRGMAASWVKTI